MSSIGRDLSSPRVVGTMQNEHAMSHPCWIDTNAHTRSEEHTSELQSLRHLVCRLLLEKKNLTFPLFGRTNNRFCSPSSIVRKHPFTPTSKKFHLPNSMCYQLLTFICFFLNNGATPEIYPFSQTTALRI